MALFQCCRSHLRHSIALCTLESGLEIWESLLGRSLVDPEADYDDWLQLLVGCVTLRQGMLPRLFEGLRRYKRSRTHLNAALLQLLALEIGGMKDVSPVGFESGLDPTLDPSRPWLSALRFIVDVIWMSAVECGGRKRANILGSEQSGGAAVASEADGVVAAHVLEAAFEVRRALSNGFPAFSFGVL